MTASPLRPESQYVVPLATPDGRPLIGPPELVQATYLLPDPEKYKISTPLPRSAAVPRPRAQYDRTALHAKVEALAKLPGEQSGRFYGWRLQPPVGKMAGPDAALAIEIRCHAMDQDRFPEHLTFTPINLDLTRPVSFHVEAYLRESIKRRGTVDPAVVLERLDFISERNAVQFKRVTAQRDIAACEMKAATGRDQRTAFTSTWSISGVMEAADREKFLLLLANGIGDRRHLGLGFFHVWQADR